MAIGSLSSLWRKASGVAAISALAIAMLGMTAPAASAAARPRPANLPRITAHAASRTAARSVAKPGISFTATNCTVTPQTPFEYFGGTFGGGEEGLAGASCNGTVYSLEVIVALFLNSTEVAFNTNTVLSTASGSADTVYPLSSGDYVTEAQICVTWTFGGSTTCSGVAATNPAVFLP